MLLINEKETQEVLNIVAEEIYELENHEFKFLRINKETGERQLVTLTSDIETI